MHYEKIYIVHQLVFQPDCEGNCAYKIDASCGEFKRKIETRNPIIPFIYNDVSPGEEIRVYLIEYESSQKNHSKTVKHYEDDFKKDFYAIKNEVKFECPDPRIITIPEPDNNKAYRNLLKMLMGTDQEGERIIDDYDTIYMDVTFGKKPLPIMLFVSLFYAYKIRKGVEIGALCYGDLHGHATNEPTLYDISEFFLLADAMGNITKFDDADELINKIVDNML